MKFTLNGKQIEVTDSWGAMTFAQNLRVFKMKDIFDKINIITGIDQEILKKANIKGLDKILYAAKFLDVPHMFHGKPTKIGEYKLPLNSKGVFDVQFESLAQFEDMRITMDKLPYLPIDVLDRLMKGKITEEDIKQYPDLIPRIYAHTEAYASYCAIYLQKLRDGEYDGDKALKMVPEIMNYPASDVIVAGGFFFVRLQSLLNGIKSNSPNTARHRKKSIGKRSRRSSARMRPLTKRQGR